MNTENEKEKEKEKIWFIHDHWDEYQAYCAQHKGNPAGFKFPDGSTIKQGDERYIFF